MKVMKMKSRALAILMSLTMAFTMMPTMSAPVYAEQSLVDVAGLKYSLNESGKTASVVEYDSIPENGAVSIPSSITHNDITYAVTSIGREAFVECSQLTSIGIPNSITEIGTYAFSGCKNLATVNIPQDSQLTTIEVGAFFGCSGLKSIEIPSSVTIISQEAFENCSNLTTVTIHGGSKTIHISMYAFSSCSKLTSISLPKLVGFSDSVFSGCSKLEKIIIPCDFDKTRFIEVISSGIIPSDTDDTFSVLSTDTTGTFEYIHDYGETVYTWSELADGSLGCTATRICKNGSSHTETAEGQVNRQYIGEPPTCTTGGKARYTATFSEDVAEWTETQTTERTISALGHDWGEWFVDKEPTVDEKGISKRICNRCGEEESKDISKLSDDGTKGEPTRLYGSLMVKMSAKGTKVLSIKWNKIQGAAGYDIFFAKCSDGKKEGKCKKVKTIKGNKTFSWTKKGLKKKTAYKAYVKAYVMKNGKKTYVSKSPMFHAYTGNGTKNYTNAKSVTVNKTKVTLKKGKTFKIKAKVNKVNKKKKLMPKSHAPTLRYMTSNSKVATVSKSGKITAKGSGTCYIYVYAHNGVSKQIKVMVK